MTNLEAKQELARKLDINYTDIANNGLFTDADLQAWIQDGVLRAWDYKPWSFTQRAKDIISTSADYYDAPSDLMEGSIYLLTVGGQEYKKVLFQDYNKYLLDNPTATDLIWTEWESYLFINKNAYTAGDEIIVYGKKLAPHVSADADLLPFSPTADNSEHSGNGAIVQLAYASALESEKKQSPQTRKALIATGIRQDAYRTLDILWKPFAANLATLQGKSRQMFNTPDFFSGSGSGGSDVGNFNYLN